MAVYAERQPIPRETVHLLKSDTELGDELREKRVSREHLVRIVEGVLHMDLAAARVVHTWLGQQIGVLEQAQNLTK